MDVSGLIHAKQDFGNKARWPTNGEKPIHWKDKSRWCAYHENFGHVTEDCIAFRKEINHLLRKGYLRWILGRRKERSRNKDQDPPKILGN